MVTQQPAAAPQAPFPEPLLTPDELAKHLKVPESWVYEQARQGKLPCEKLGHYVRFRLADVEAALAKTNEDKD
jgi:excisionase family DNA binding protein